jgi:Domain of Unknown Function (DUF1206)
MATLNSSASAVKRAAVNPKLEILERLGYAVRGALYAAMGILALRIVLGVAGGQATDLTGALVFLVSNPLGKLVLIVAVVGLAAYSLWGFVRAIYDPLHRGSDKSGYLARLGFVSSAISYAAIVIFGLKLLTGSGASAGDTTKQTVASVLTHPAGGALTILLGLIVIGVAIGQFVESYRATFQNDLKGAEMSPATRTVVVRLGRFGMFSRGVIFLVIGWFVVQAGIHHDPAQAQGFGGAFAFLLAQPFGQIVLGIVALGFVALGLHSFACARWVKLMGSNAA